MLVSGYGPSIRKDILEGALQRDQELRLGARYRSREQIRLAKQENLTRHVNTWFLKGEVTSTLSVQATVGGNLKRAVQEAVGGSRAPDGGKTLVLERGGKSILAGLRRADPFLAEGCPFQEKCLVRGRRSCWTAGVVYALICGQCGAKYVGTSGCTSHKRCREHYGEWLGGSGTNAMSKHWSSRHPEADRASISEPFTMEILGAGFGGNLERYVQEALKIKTTKEAGAELLNSRGEWSRVQLRRLVVQAE